MVSAGVVPDVRAGSVFEGGLALVRNQAMFTPPAPQVAVQTLTGRLWSARRQHAVELEDAVVALMSAEDFDGDMWGNRLMVSGVLTVDNQWWQPGPLRDLLPRGWRTWRVLEAVDAGRGRSGDRLVRLQAV
jgi:hypothetical protein